MSTLRHEVGHLVEHVAALRATPVAQWSTRDRILLEASRLIAAKGYHGASTRDITTAVGIRQPSLFNHFASKLDILDTLLRYDLSVSAEHARTQARAGGPAAERLHRYLQWDVHWYAEVPFDLSGLQEELLTMPGLEARKADLEAWRRGIERIVRDGIASGEFHAGTERVVTTVMSALSWEIVRTAARGADPRTVRRLGDAAATFVMRGLVREQPT